MSEQTVHNGRPARHLFEAEGMHPSHAPDFAGMCDACHCGAGDAFAAQPCPGHTPATAFQVPAP